jgi:hypothetical protein
MAEIKIALTGIIGLIGLCLLLAFGSSEIGNVGMAAVFILIALLVIVLFFFAGKGGGSR